MVCFVISEAFGSLDLNTAAAPLCGSGKAFSLTSCCNSGSIYNLFAFVVGRIKSEFCCGFNFCITNRTFCRSGVAYCFTGSCNSGSSFNLFAFVVRSI
jgi:hypothetical protein